MKLYFLKVGSKYLSKESKFDSSEVEGMNLHYTFFPEEARYWDKESSVKGVRTFLKNRGLDVTIMVGTVEIDTFKGNF